MSRNLQLHEELNRSIPNCEGSFWLSRRKVTDLYFIGGTFPRQGISRTPEAASLLTSLHPQMASLCPIVKDALDSKTTDEVWSALPKAEREDTLEKQWTPSEITPIPCHMTDLQQNIFPCCCKKNGVGQAETTMAGSRIWISILVNWKNRDWPCFPWSHNTCTNYIFTTTLRRYSTVKRSRTYDNEITQEY